MLQDSEYQSLANCEQMPSYGTATFAAIVGNEDGAHWSSAQLFRPLSDTDWTIPAEAAR